MTLTILKTHWAVLLRHRFQPLFERILLTADLLSIQIARSTSKLSTVRRSKQRRNTTELPSTYTYLSLGSNDFSLINKHPSGNTKNRGASWTATSPRTPSSITHSSQSSFYTTPKAFLFFRLDHRPYVQSESWGRVLCLPYSALLQNTACSGIHHGMGQQGTDGS